VHELVIIETEIACFVDQLFFRRIPALYLVLRDVSKTVLKNRCI